MDISLTIEDYKLKQMFEKALESKVAELIEPRIVKWLQEAINDEAVAKIIEQRIKNTIEYGTRGIDISSVEKMINDKLAQIAAGITDEYLKNMLLEKLIKKME